MYPLYILGKRNGCTLSKHPPCVSEICFRCRGKSKHKVHHCMIDGQNKWDLAVRSQCDIELRQARWQARALVPLPLSHWRAPCVKVDERTCTTRTNWHEQLAACSAPVCPTSKQSPPARAADESYYISSLSLALQFLVRPFTACTIFVRYVLHRP